MYKIGCLALVTFLGYLVGEIFGSMTGGAIAGFCLGILLLGIARMTR